jgi:capsular exopolysaccharide synthesis family protein
MSEKSRSGGASNGLVVVSDPRSAAAEAYRTLHTNLRFILVGQSVRTILFTSAGPNEGKSTTLANLAVVTAQTGAKVLVVDCDLRKPSLHQTFSLPNERGFTSAFLEADFESLPVQRTSVEGLSVLTSGPLPPTPAELLSHEQTARIFAALAKTVDVIMVDSPPVTAVADASILAPRADGVVLVLDARHTRREQARRAKEQLERVNAHILGVVLNNTRVSVAAYG